MLCSPAKCMETKKSQYRFTAHLPLNRDELLSFSNNLEDICIVGSQLEGGDLKLEESLDEAARYV